MTTDTDYIPQSRIAEICAGGYNTLIPAWAAAKKGGAICRGEQYYAWPEGAEVREGFSTRRGDPNDNGLSITTVKTLFQAGLLELAPTSGIINPATGQTRSTREAIAQFCSDYGFTMDDLRCTAEGLDSAPLRRVTQPSGPGGMSPEQFAAMIKAGSTPVRGV